MSQGEIPYELASGVPISTPMVAPDFMGKIAARESAVPDHTLLEQRGSGQCMMVFGIGAHNRNPDSPILMPLGDAWNEWLNSTDGTPERLASRIVINEGGVRSAFSPGTGTREVIARGGEQGLVAHLAYGEDIEVISGEPPDRAEIHAASMQHSIKAVVRYQFMRFSRQLSEGGISMDEAQSFLDTAMQLVGVELNSHPESRFAGYDFSFAHFAQDYEETYDHPFDIADYKFHLEESVLHMYDDGPEKSEVRLVSRTVNEARDQSYLQLLQQLWGAGKSPFFVVGEAHALKLQKEIQKIGTPKTEGHIHGYSQCTVRSLASPHAAEALTQGGDKLGYYIGHAAWAAEFMEGRGSPVAPTNELYVGNAAVV